MSYEITKAATDDWENIAELTLKNDGEDAMRGLFKALDTNIKKMAADDKSWRFTFLYGQEVQIGHHEEYFVLGVLRQNKPLLVFAIFHQDTEIMLALIKRMNFFGDHRTASQIAAEMQNVRITKADHAALTADDDEG